MSHQAEAFWVSEPNKGELRSEQLPAPGEGQVRVRTRFSGISRGTEALVFAGRVPASQRSLMRAPFQEGEFPAPVKYGYASVGEVEHGPDHLLGQSVFCLFPHQDLYLVPIDAVVALPAGLSPERAILAANAETALNVVWDAAVGPGDRVCVIGGGVVGCLVAWLAGKIPGTDVTLVDLQPQRAAIAALLQVAFSPPDAAPPDQDVVIHASASEAGLVTALGCAGLEATVVEASWFGDQRPSLPLGEAFHSRRLTLRSSQVGRLPAARTGRWTLRRRLQKALQLLLDARLDCLISGESRFRELPDTMPRLAQGGGDVLCHRIVY
ncbi:MAG: dehydrogenase [Wenzhouxiangella sp.]|nr:MAG: dehydrogenase [Wenzhouxiangella sp.]